MGQSRLHTNELSRHIQVASITGLWGISFILFCCRDDRSSLERCRKTMQRHALTIVVGVVICALFLFGEWRLRSNPSAQSVTVTLIAKDVPMSAYLGPEDASAETVA